MGKRGPAPEPSILKYIRGNPSKDALPTNEPTPSLVPQDFPPPKTLDAKGIEVWNDTVPKLARMRVLTEADVPTLTRYCIESSLYLDCYEKVKTGTNCCAQPHAVGRRSKHIPVQKLPINNQLFLLFFSFSA